MKIDGAVVVVTGGGGGIGEALVDAVVRAGASAVVVSDLDEAAAKRVAARHDNATAYAADVSSRVAIEELVNTTEARFGRIDLFCSNAGVMVDAGLELQDAQWGMMWSVNVMAHVHAARACMPGMLARGSGYFLNTSSAAGILTAPGAAAYATTKHGANGFAEWLAIVYGDRGIGVSVLCPEAVQTKMLSESMANGNEGIRRVAAAGVLEPAVVASKAIAGIEANQFLILSHEKTLEYTQRKWSDIGRWIAGMQKFLRAAR